MPIPENWCSGSPQGLWITYPEAMEKMGSHRDKSMDNLGATMENLDE